MCYFACIAFVVAFFNFHEWNFQDPTTKATQQVNKFALYVGFFYLCCFCCFGVCMSAVAGTPQQIVPAIPFAILTLALAFYMPYYMFTSYSKISAIEKKGEFKDNASATFVVKATFAIITLITTCCGIFFA